MFFENLWIDIKYGAVTAWFNVEAGFRTAWANIVKVWDQVKQGFADGWEIIKTQSVNAWNSVVTWWQGLGPWFQTNVIDPIVLLFQTACDNIKLFFQNAWNKVVLIWTNASTWFHTNITEPIKNAFDTALLWIQDKWQTVFTAIQDFVKDKINAIIGFLNAMIGGIVSGINSVISALNSIHVSIPSWVPEIGGKSFGINLPKVTPIQIPYLATGAVIPANAPFAAILGDQRNGTNIEAPADLIRQIVGEEVANAVGSQNISINFKGSLGALVKELKPYIDKENNRVGSSFLVGGNA
jgi:hypothetical protein